MIEDVRLDDLITLQRGFDITEKEQKVGSVPVISSGGISSYHNEFKAKGPGVVIGRKGTLGKVYYTSENYWPHDTSLWVKDFKGNDPKFIYYLLKLLHFEKFDAGAANPTLNRNHIHSLKIKVPKKEFRRKIANILSAYDELIENNKKRIKLLEEMAEEIYKEWFVRMRFPGYEKTKFFNEQGKQVPHGTNGALPEGWEKVKINEVTNNYDNKRKPLSSMDRLEIQGRYPYYGAAKIIDYINDFIFEGKYLLIAEDGSVITNDGYPVLQFVNEKFWVSNHAHVLEGKYPISTEYLYLSLSKYPIIGLVTGAAQPKINQENLNRITLLKPSVFYCEKFNEICIPLFDEILILNKKNLLLQETRDLLLPRLMSGKLNVEELA